MLDRRQMGRVSSGWHVGYGFTALAVACLNAAVDVIQRLSPAAQGADPQQMEQLIQYQLRQRPRAIDDPSSVTRRLTTAYSSLRSAPTDDLGGQRLPTNLRVVAGPGPVATRRDHRPAGVRTVPFDLPLMLVTGDTLYLARATVATAPHRPLVVEEPATIGVVTACHDLLWHASMADSGIASRPLPTHLYAVLREMATGATDARAARNLHQSDRTFSRRAAELLRHLEATSRFQAGIAAARRGYT